MTNSVMLIGAGGHCRAVIDVIRASQQYEIKGILDLPHSIGRDVIDVPIIGTDEDIPRYAKMIGRFVITVGHLGHASLRQKISQRVVQEGGEFVSVVSPKAHMGLETQVGKGTVIFHYAVINTGAQLGNHCIVNTGAIVEHDSVVEDHVHISTNAVVNGACQVGYGTFLGSGSIVNHNVKIANHCVLGSGAVATKDTTTGRTYVGIPAREVKRK